MNMPDIFSISTDGDFEKFALSAFSVHAKHNPVYGKWVEKLGKKEVNAAEEIPFMPVSFFKNERVVLFPEQRDEKIFTSSTTGGGLPSKHYVHDLSLYVRSFSECFTRGYGPAENYLVLCLLPSYLEREGSSLVFMAEHFIEKSKYDESGFFLYNHSELKNILEKYDASGTKILLLGVSFALLDFAENNRLKLRNIVVMETGGMKGKRHEISREELHEALCLGFGVEKIHSEYGMCELLSQSYSKGGGIFTGQPWLKMFVADIYDPLTILKATKERPVRGALHIIDLANWYSCPFIATEDLAEQYADGSVKILGRLAQAETRGCNLLIE